MKKRNIYVRITYRYTICCFQMFSFVLHELKCYLFHEWLPLRHDCVRNCSFALNKMTLSFNFTFFFIKYLSHFVLYILGIFYIYFLVNVDNIITRNYILNQWFFFFNHRSVSIIRLAVNHSAKLYKYKLYIKNFVQLEIYYSRLIDQCADVTLDNEPTQ